MKDGRNKNVQDEKIIKEKLARAFLRR